MILTVMIKKQNLKKGEANLFPIMPHYSTALCFGSKDPTLGGLIFQQQPVLQQACFNFVKHRTPNTKTVWKFRNSTLQNETVSLPDPEPARIRPETQDSPHGKSYEEQCRCGGGHKAICKSQSQPRSYFAHSSPSSIQVMSGMCSVVFAALLPIEMKTLPGQRRPPSESWEAMELVRRGGATGSGLRSINKFMGRKCSQQHLPLLGCFPVCLHFVSI